MKNYSLILTMLFGFLSLNLNAQDTKKQKQEATSQHIKAAIESGKFIFKAQSATPARGRVIQLTSGYELAVIPGEMKCDFVILEGYFPEVMEVQMEESTSLPSHLPIL